MGLIFLPNDVYFQCLHEILALYYAQLRVPWQNFHCWDWCRGYMWNTINL